MQDSKIYLTIILTFIIQTTTTLAWAQVISLALNYIPLVLCQWLMPNYRWLQLSKLEKMHVPYLKILHSLVKLLVFGVKSCLSRKLYTCLLKSAVYQYHTTVYLRMFMPPLDFLRTTILQTCLSFMLKMKRLSVPIKIQVKNCWKVWEGRFEEWLTSNKDAFQHEIVRVPQEQHNPPQSKYYE